MCMDNYAYTDTHTDLPETGAEVTHNKGVIVNAFLSKLKANGYPGSTEISSRGSGKFWGLSPVKSLCRARI